MLIQSLCTVLAVVEGDYTPPWAASVRVFFRFQRIKLGCCCPHPPPKSYSAWLGLACLMSPPRTAGFCQTVYKSSLGY